MSRGLGKIELDVLTIFEAGELLSSAEVATRVFGCPVPSAAEYSSVCRALASLARKGLADADGTRAWGSLKAVQSQRRKKLRLQSTHQSGLDAYFTPPVAVHALLSVERQHLPQHIWEPAAGAGAIVHVLRGAGYTVVASDIADYGLAGCELVDYLSAPLPPDVEAAVTNPPSPRPRHLPARCSARFAMWRCCCAPISSKAPNGSHSSPSTRLPACGFRACACQ
jgi:hypothetical protein